MKKSAPDLSMMTHVPLQAHWFAQLPAFQSRDPQIVRACINMLMGAFHGQPCGTINNTPEAIATVAQLPVEIAIEHLPTLTKGWKKEKDLIVFAPMASMAERLAHNYGDAIQRLQEGAVVAIAAPDLFKTELLPEQGETLAKQVGEKTLTLAEQAMAATKVKRALPPNAGLTSELRQFLLEKGFKVNGHDEIWARFADYMVSNRKTSACWSAEFRNWTHNQIKFGNLINFMVEPPQMPGLSPVNVSFARRPAVPRFSFDRGAAAQQSTMDRLSAAQRHINARNATNGVVMNGEVA